MNVKLQTITALASLVVATAFAAPASAQTPGQYCATVSGCEILDVTGGGGTAGTYAPTLVKYCKNSKLNVTLVSTYLYTTSQQDIYIAKLGGGANILARNHSSSLDPLNNDDCPNLP